MRKNKLFATALAVMAMAGNCVVPAFALEYNYTTDPYDGFYKSTSADDDAIANSDTIVVGSDGTIAAGTQENVSSSPFSSFTLPIGQYPDSWGKETDIAIAQNTIFPNVLAPTAQMTNVNAPVKYDMGRINSSALPTPIMSQQYSGSSYNYAGGNMMGVTTQEAPMDKITSGGAIAKVEIPSIGVSELVYEGTSNESMRSGLGHFAETSGWEGNIGLAGHNRGTYGVFENLSSLKIGDLITYTTAYGVKQYKVMSISTCSATDTSGLLQDGTNKLTLYTCVANQPSIRRMVVAVQV